MAKLQPMSVDSAIKPIKSSQAFERYDSIAQVHNQKLKPQQPSLLQQAAELLANNPRLGVTA